jgi:hypothetical protein
MQHGPSEQKIITATSRGAAKLRKQIPPTIAAAERNDSVAATQSPLIALTNAP